MYIYHIKIYVNVNVNVNVNRSSIKITVTEFKFFTILVSFPQIGACIRGERVPALIKIYGDTVSIQR